MLVLPACLSSPELKDCFEFEIGSQAECGDDACEIYCEAMVDRCPNVFPTVGVCLNDCANEPVDPDLVIPGTFGDQSGNSIACRLTKLAEGGSDACQEASLLQTTQCVENVCQEYCDTMLTACVGSFLNEENCLATCALFPRLGSDEDANSAECRLKYANRAQSSGTADDCNAAAPHGNNVCGDTCDTYCNFVEAHCRDENQVYADRAACLATCELMDTEGDFRDYEFERQVDTVACRIWHAGPPALNNPETHCVHGLPYNSDFCGFGPQWPCDNFCNNVLRNCTGVYDTKETCLADCATFPEVIDLPDPLPEGVTTTVDLFPQSTSVCPTQ
jgi:hypothetical protein